MTPIFDGPFAGAIPPGISEKSNVPTKHLPTSAAFPTPFNPEPLLP